MVRRTTIELDEDLLSRAREALGTSTTRATVETALRHATEHASSEQERKRARQLDLLERLPQAIDTQILASGEMWR